MEFDELSNKVIGLAIEVHRELGPGLLENTYKQCLAYELSQAQIKFQIEVELPVQYKKMHISCGYMTTFRTSFTKKMVTTSFSKRSLKIE
jgi:GxxExxY protein